MTPSGVDEQIVTEWVQRAEDDARTARAILKDRDGAPTQVCFLSQQLVEKWLKAALVYFTGEHPKAHTLDVLSTLLQPHVSVLLNDHAEALKELSAYYVTARYPTEVPYESFTWERAEQAFAAAEQVSAVIRKALGRS